jgi:membrane dipeptidase
VLVDCSHVSDDVMRQAIDVSDAPVVFSHSGARTLADVPRNVPDDVLEQVGRTGAIVMATFVPWFVTNEGAEQSREWWAELHRLREAHPDDRDTVTREIEAWERARPAASVTAADVADHIDHIHAVAGIEAIGIGGDYDGVPTMGDELVDVSTYPLIFEELRARRYTDDDLRAIAGGNVLRLMRSTEAVADRLRSRPPSTASIESLDDTSG